MEVKNSQPISDAEWYCRHDLEEEQYYKIFFELFRKYNVRWISADEKERQFIEEVTKVRYERERALRLGFPLSEVRPSFCRKSNCPA